MLNHDWLYFNGMMVLRCIAVSKDVALFLRIKDQSYVVAHYYKVYDTNTNRLQIDWAFGHYFYNIESAIMKYNELREREG